MNTPPLNPSTPFPGSANLQEGVPPVNLADPEYTIENIHFLLSMRGEKEPFTSIESSIETMRLVDELYREAERSG